MSRFLTTFVLAAFAAIATASGDEPPRLRVLTYNIHHGEGTDGKFDLDRLAKIIRDCKADVVALQEVDVKTRRASGVDQAARLGELTRMHHAFGKAMDFSGGEYGEAILSRWPIAETENHALPHEAGQEPRAALAARIRPEGKLPEFWLIGTHLCHQSETTRTRQAETIQAALDPAAAAPQILAGDFNARTKSPTMQTLLAKRWVDATAKVSKIDYVLIRPGDPWRVVEVQALDEPVASDHLPVLAVLEWTQRD